MCCWCSTCLNSSKHCRWWTPGSNRMPSRHQFGINVDCGHIIYNHTCVFLRTTYAKTLQEEQPSLIPSQNSRFMELCYVCYLQFLTEFRLTIFRPPWQRLSDPWNFPANVGAVLSSQCQEIRSAKSLAPWFFQFFSARAFVKKQIQHSESHTNPNLPFWTLLLQQNLPSTTCRPAESANNHGFPHGFGQFHVHFRWLCGHFLAPDSLPVPCQLRELRSASLDQLPCHRCCLYWSVLKNPQMEAS